MDDPGPVERSRPGAAESMPGLSPVRAFFLLAAVAAAIPLGIFATRDEAAPSESPPAVRSPDFSLTDAEAVAEFRELRELMKVAYRNRDLSLVKTFAVLESDLDRRVQDEIRTLLRDRVVDVTEFRSRSTFVIENQATEIRIRQVLVEYPRFRDERTGRDVTIRTKPQQQTVLWTLRLVGSEWRLESGLITAARALRGSDG